VDALREIPGLIIALIRLLWQRLVNIQFSEEADSWQITMLAEP